ncbi:MAG: hypothetical protein NZZ60_03175 [Bacteroidia bacterium]|nr:hypothetical protein [Bacteroidia bacterium]MCX7652048.1 hypothetical protein [Bacteroidia bacterium]MDW8416281.1 hypothetical protein [Bacteroidia bacterium]
MRKCVASALVGILSLSCLEAQTQKVWGGAGWVGAGYTVLTGHDGLREALEAKGLSVSRSLSGFLIGGGGGAYLGRVFVGGYGEVVSGEELNGGYGFFRMGYFWRLGNRFILLPTVGIGGGGYAFTVSSRPEQVDFSQAIEPGSGIPPRSLSAGGAKGSISLALQYFNKGFMIGFEAGYGRSLSGFRDWETAGISLQNGPNITPQQLYLRLLIGGGGLALEGEN